MDLDSPIPYTVADGGPVPCGPAGARSSHDIDSCSVRVRRIYGPGAVVLAVRSTLVELVDPTRPLPRVRVSLAELAAERTASARISYLALTRPRGSR